MYLYLFVVVSWTISFLLAMRGVRRASKVGKHRESRDNCGPIWGECDHVCHLRICSHLLFEHGARVLFSLGTNVNTAVSQIHTTEFVPSDRSSSTLCSGARWYLGICSTSVCT